MNIEIEDLRIAKLQEYLVNVINDITQKNNKINISVLPKDVNSYSIDKIPTDTEVERWITGIEIHRDVYDFRTRKDFSYDDINNLKNIGFFEIFEEKIREHNNNKILPDIDGIESIECLNCGSQESANTGTAEFSIQVQIKFRIN